MGWRSSLICDSVRVKHPSVLNRIHPVKGQMSMPDLRLSPEERIMLIENVNIVIHIAATVKINESLNLAVNIV
ncbi:fatty acyl-CoA reductase wat-like [Frieseomelitta varia]|uniref:fatty acyl-CoA reductase wat-like n=1 Tax=Frieseomelitta varia TaxID=561572 RepID=UPI001CB6793C|nr:fatty acyl-CoA reductase wat-like [Frieseomelitta varia]